MSLLVLTMLTMTTLMSTTGAFTIRRPLTKPHHQQQFALNMIDKNIADMIDQEYYRQHHKEEYHQQWMVQHQPQIRSTPGKEDHTTFTATAAAVGVLDTYQVENDENDDTILNRRQWVRDEKLARTNPQQYCMDRCIATGYCDVYEDLYVCVLLLVAELVPHSTRMSYSHINPSFILPLALSLQYSFDMTPTQVVAFCTDCVLAVNDDDATECPVPDAFYDHMNNNNNSPKTGTFRP